MDLTRDRLSESVEQSTWHHDGSLRMRYQTCFALGGPSIAILLIFMHIIYICLAEYSFNCLGACFIQKKVPCYTDLMHYVWDYIAVSEYVDAGMHGRTSNFTGYHRVCLTDHLEAQRRHSQTLYSTAPTGRQRFSVQRADDAENLTLQFAMSCYICHITFWYAVSEV